MNSIALTNRKVTPRRIALLTLVAFVVFGAVYEFGCMFEFEYPFWPTLWLAEQTRTPDGSRITELIRSRSGSSYVSQHWHHCTWCDVVYPHAPHLAIKVTVNDDDERHFYLFDWDATHRRLLPITVRTAKVFPELIPAGDVVEPSGVGLNPQLYNNDQPCHIMPPNTNTSLEPTPVGAFSSAARSTPQVVGGSVLGR